jgi:hypothetical protein
MLLVAMAFVAGALMIALISLSPAPERARTPRRQLVGLDRRRQQTQRRMRVTEALAFHEFRLRQQRAAAGLAVAKNQPPLPRNEWTQSDPALGIRRSFAPPMQPVVPAWQNWMPTPAAGQQDPAAGSFPELQQAS